MMSTAVCQNPNCGCTFVIKPKQKANPNKYCSKACFVAPREERTCMLEACNNTFIYLSSSKKRYCCAGHSHKGKPRSPNAGRKKTWKTVICALCGKEFGCKKGSSRTYCSRACSCKVKSFPEFKAKLLMLSQKAALVNKGVPRTEEVKRKIGAARKGRLHSDEAKKRISDSCAGKYVKENNPNWRGGVSVVHYTKEWTKRLRNEIKQRDDYHCQLCDCNDNLHIHHINYNKKDCSPINLITLCKCCHMKTNFDRDYWQMMFERRMRVLYLIQKEAI